VRQVLSVAALVLATACTSSTTATPRTTPTPQAGETAVPAPSHPTLWLCQPSTLSDPCHAPLTATAMHADGSTTAVPAPARRQPVDCFYVYPTVSSSPTENAPLKVTPAETSTAKAQVAAFSSVCRVWAPIYRQLTVHALVTGGFGDSKARALAHADVLDAWHDYLRLNPGRRFVLIGHSQGSFELLALLQQEIDGHEALRQRLVSALLIGGNLKVPAGKPVGGDLQNIPLCTRDHEQGCVVAYNTYGSRPPANGLFGRPDTARKLVAACTNPAALAGGPGTLRPLFPSDRALPGAPAVRSPFTTYPDYVTGECRSAGGFTWLQVSVRRVPGDTRPAAVPETLGPAWGLHLVDVNIALGNLVDLVRAQTG
jgi:hypothetical protein